MASLLSRGPLVWFLVHAYHLVFVCLIWGSGRPVSANSYPGNGIIQNPVVSCQDVKKKILCLPLEYSKFDLPYRNEHNLIDIGKYTVNIYRYKTIEANGNTSVIPTSSKSFSLYQELLQPLWVIYQKMVIYLQRLKEFPV